jgi:maleate cis-trans isomerase
VKNTFLASAGAEGVFVPCGQFTVPHIAELEADIGVPVIAGTYAHIWAGLKMIKIKAGIRGHGRLLETVAD